MTEREALRSQVQGAGHGVRLGRPDEVAHDIGDRPRLPPLSSLLNPAVSTIDHESDHAGPSNHTPLKASDYPHRTRALSSAKEYKHDHGTHPYARSHDKGSASHRTPYPPSSDHSSYRRPRFRPSASDERQGGDADPYPHPSASVTFMQRQSPQPYGDPLMPALPSFGTLTRPLSPPAPSNSQNDHRDPMSRHDGPFLSSDSVHSPPQHTGEALSSGSTAPSPLSAQASYRSHLPFVPYDRRWSGPIQGQGRDDSIVSRAFDKLWDLFLTTRRHVESVSNPNDRPSDMLPSIHHGDLNALHSYLQREVDLLQALDPQAAQYIHHSIYGVMDELHSSEWQQQQQQHQPPHPPSDGYRAPYGPTTAWSDGNSSGYRRPAHRRVFSGRASDPYIHFAGGSGSGGAEASSSSTPYAAPAPLDSTERQVPPVGPYAESPQSTFAQSPSMSYYNTSPYAQAAFVAPTSLPKRVRKRRDEAEQHCLGCHASETPEWRGGGSIFGKRSLCNSCGLFFAKQCRKRGIKWTSTEMTEEERDNIVLELQMAVQARKSQGRSSKQ